METYQWIIAALAGPAAYGGVQVFGKIDKRVESIRKIAYKLAEICEKAELELFHAFFEAIAIGDKSGAIRAGKQIIKEMAPDKILTALERTFYKQLKYRLENGDDNEMKIVRIVDEHRVASEAKQRMQLRINADNASRRQAEVPAAPTPNDLPATDTIVVAAGGL